ncbi:MAG: hypothetical protein KDK60_00700, partial [Chlamydiia bacterium]|nr:hypothetical protein [Chlamydiia bacterium]
DPLCIAPIHLNRSNAEGVKDGDADTGKNQVLSFLGYKEGLNKAAEKGHLPLGRFREIAYQKIAEECEMLTASEQTEGHAFNCTAKLSDLIKVYPHYLVLCAENNLPLIAAKTKVSLSLTVDPKEALKAYHEYFHLAQQTPSPLHPLLADALLRKDESALQKQIKTAINDQYLSLIFSSPKEYDPHVIFHTWAPVLRKVFRPLMEMIS